MLTCMCAYLFRPIGISKVEQVLKKCERLLELLEQHDEEIYSSWTAGLEELCHTHLQEPPLTLNSETDLLEVNFNPAVSHSELPTSQ